MMFRPLYKGSWAVMTVSRFHIVISFGASLMLSGCLGNIMPFSQKTDYTLSGIEENDALSSYLQDVLDDRLSEKLEESDDPVLAARRETYREEMIKADLVKALQGQGLL